MQEIDGIKKVDVFDLSNASEKDAYEELINKEGVEVTKTEFAYVRAGDPKVTVFYQVEEDL